MFYIEFFRKSHVKYIPMIINFISEDEEVSFAQFLDLKT